MHLATRSVEYEAGTRRVAKSVARRFGWIALAAAFLIMLPGGTAFAQDTGSVVGVILDSSGAVVPGVTVSATNKATGVVTAGVSGSAGEYEVPNLRTGIYKVSAARSGFTTAVADNVLVSIGVRQHIDLTLKVGQAATTVEVSDVALQIDTETSERGQTVSGYQTEALPLVSRNFSDFLALVTGSRQAPTAATTSSITQPGARGRLQRQRPAQHVQQLSCSTAWTTTPTAKATRASTTRSSPSRPIPLPSSTW